MGFSYTSIRRSQVKQCRDCQSDIFLVRNRNGKWFAVDVYYDQRFKSLVYRHSGGAYSNLTPWHKCQPKRDYAAESLVHQANACIRKLCLSYLQKRRESKSHVVPNDDKWQRIFELANNRAIRRVAALPEGSRAHMMIQ